MQEAKENGIKILERLEMIDRHIQQLRDEVTLSKMNEGLPINAVVK